MELEALTHLPEWQATTTRAPVRTTTAERPRNAPRGGPSTASPFGPRTRRGMCRAGRQQKRRPHAAYNTPRPSEPAATVPAPIVELTRALARSGPTGRAQCGSTDGPVQQQPLAGTRVLCSWLVPLVISRALPLAARCAGTCPAQPRRVSTIGWTGFWLAGT